MQKQQKQQKNSTIYHVKKAIKCEREIINIKIKENAITIAFTLLTISFFILTDFGVKTLSSIITPYYLDHQKISTYIIYAAVGVSVIYAHWTTYVCHFYLNNNFGITANRVKNNRNSIYTIALMWSGIFIKMMIVLFILSLPFEWVLLVEQVILTISIIINILLSIHLLMHPVKLV